MRTRNAEIADLERRVKILECGHKKTEWQKALCSDTYIEICPDCGKVLRSLSEEEMLKERRSKLSRELDDINRRIEGLKK